VTSYKATVNPVRDYAASENLRLHKWTPNFAPPENFNLGLVVSFGHLLPRKLIESFGLGMLNIHASLLPNLRGASPIIHAIKHGHKETGVSLMKIKADKFDIGEILAQRSVEIGERVRMPELHDQLAEIGASLLVDCLYDLPRLYENCWGQDNCLATYGKKSLIF
jgi:methionyl-tRNA formyltransferase